MSYMLRETYIVMAVHAQALYLIDDLCVLAVILGAGLRDLAAHVLEEVLRQTFLRHDQRLLRLSGSPWVLGVAEWRWLVARRLRRGAGVFKLSRGFLGVTQVGKILSPAAVPDDGGVFWPLPLP